MVKDIINISKIESYLHSIIDNKVSNNTFVGTLPSTIQSSWNDICLIDVGNIITDLNAYGRGVIHVLLYAKPLSDGSKNVAVMSKLEQALNDVIDTQQSQTYQINRRTTYAEYDAERKWHCNVVALNILIY